MLLPQSYFLQSLNQKSVTVIHTSIFKDTPIIKLQSEKSQGEDIGLGLGLK